MHPTKYALFALKLKIAVIGHFDYKYAPFYANMLGSLLNCWPSLYIDCNREYCDVNDTSRVYSKKIQFNPDHKKKLYQTTSTPPRLSESPGAKAWRKKWTPRCLWYMLALCSAPPLGPLDSRNLPYGRPAVMFRAKYAVLHHSDFISGYSEASPCPSGPRSPSADR